MFTRIRSFLSRHRRKFFVTGLVIGGTVLLSRYVQRALRNWQEREMKEFLERTRKQQHYENLERTCNQTALTCIPSIKELTVKTNDTNSLIEKLKDGNCNKVAVWQELKILAFSKMTFLIYLSSLLMVTLRLQLNLIGGYMCRNAIEENKDSISSSLQEKYLAANQFLFHGGMEKLSELIKEKVQFVLKNRSLKENLGLKDIEQIFWSIHQAINSDSRNPCQHLASYVITTNGVVVPDPQSNIYRKIMAETNELLESEEVISLAHSAVSRGFSFFLDNVSEYFIDRSITQLESKPANSGDSFFAANIPLEKGEPIYITIPMAKVIPIISGLVSNRDTQNDIAHTWLQQLILMENLKLFGANVYECFSA